MRVSASSSRPRPFRSFLFLILISIITAAAWPGGNGASALMAATDTAEPPSPAPGDASPTEFVTSDDTAGVDEGDLCFVYTGDGMADPDRRAFPVQPEYAPDLPFTITDTLAVSTAGGGSGGAPPSVVGYIWFVRNAKVATDQGNVVFGFAGYAVTHQPYLDIKVEAHQPGEFKIDATMYTVEPGDVTSFRVRQAKKGKTKVIIDDNTTPLEPGDLGFVGLSANPSVIGIGEGTTLTAQLLTPERALDPADGVDLRVAAPVALGPTPSVDGRAAFAYMPDRAGLLPLAASAPDYTPDDPEALAVVEVQELCLSRGVIVKPGDPGYPDQPEEPGLIYGYVPLDPDYPTVTVIAKPNLPLPDDKLPQSWFLRVGETGPIAPDPAGHPDDTKTCVTLDALTVGGRLIIAGCGTMQKRMCLVIQAQPSVEIQVYQTPDDADDLVQVHSDHPPNRFRTNCRARLTNSQGDAVTVVLINPDGQIRFHEVFTPPDESEGSDGGDAPPEEPPAPDPGETTREIELPASGEWVEFSVSGESGSAAVDDAVIEAREGNAGGRKMGSEEMTVFWFDESSIEVMPISAYSLYDTIISTGNSADHSENPYAAIFVAEAKIFPEGVDTTQPMTSPLRVGFIQNVFKYELSVVYSNLNDSAFFDVNAPFGTEIAVPESIKLSILSNDEILDSSDDNRPLYTRSDFGLVQPFGFPEGKSANASDTPRGVIRDFPYIHTVYQDETGDPIASVMYQSIESVTFYIHFSIWCVVYNTETEEYTCFNYVNWQINYEQLDEEIVSAMPTSSDLSFPPPPVPVTSGGIGNTLVNSDEWREDHLSISPVGDGVRTYSN